MTLQETIDLIKSLPPCWFSLKHRGKIKDKLKDLGFERLGSGTFYSVWRFKKSDFVVKVLHDYETSDYRETAGMAAVFPAKNNPLSQFFLYPLHTTKNRTVMIQKYVEQPNLDLYDKFIRDKKIKDYVSKWGDWGCYNLGVLDGQIVIRDFTHLIFINRNRSYGGNSFDNEDLNFSPQTRKIA